MTGWHGSLDDLDTRQRAEAVDLILDELTPVPEHPRGPWLVISESRGRRSVELRGRRPLRLWPAGSGWVVFMAVTLWGALVGLWIAS